ncbi:MAG: phospholipase D family protein [Candidatus Dadabacteria bacterium]|nr:phospholipase D family protein [Candidatus Dadabacteria bacterium]
MSVRLVDAHWDRELEDAVRTHPTEIRVVCPFIKKHALECLLSHRPRDIRVITRFNLKDFAEGVSDLEALRMLFEAGASIHGIKHLHAKLYLFGTSRAIITSANLTKAALTRNSEFGVVADEAAVVAACQSYFEKLWQRGNQMSSDDLDSWEKKIARHRLAGGRPRHTRGLDDFGADLGPVATLPVPLPIVVTDADQAFVKFLGENKNRVPLSFATIEEINKAGCHWALAYPAERRPRRVKDGAVMFIARLTKEPNDIRIFGRAIGMKYHPVRDDASPVDIERRPWKEKWPRYIRVHNAEFVAGTMANGISLNELMNTLEDKSFASTQHNADNGTGNTDPRRAYMRQPSVELSQESTFWLEKHLQAAFDKHGRVSQDTLDQLDWPTLP